MSDIIRLDKMLGEMGYGTRKEIKKLIKDGLVKVDGNIVRDPGNHINIKVQSVTVNGEKLDYRKYIYIMMNKPAGVISATESPYEKTVVGLLPEKYLNFKPSPVGRLDKDTLGLLLLTNDGELIHRLISPKKHVPKVYVARVRGTVTEEDIDSFKKGVILDDGYRTLPAGLKIIEQGDISTVEVEIFEGKYHQVKRMFEAVGKKVVLLERISIGPLKLDTNLKAGEFRELTSHELELLQEDICLDIFSRISRN